MINEKPFLKIYKPLSNVFFEDLKSNFSESFPRIDLFDSGIIIFTTKTEYFKISYSEISQIDLIALLYKDGNYAPHIYASLFLNMNKIPPFTDIYTKTKLGNIPFVINSNSVTDYIGYQGNKGIILNIGSAQEYDPRGKFQSLNVNFNTNSTPIMKVNDDAEYNFYLKNNFGPETYEKYKRS